MNMIFPSGRQIDSGDVLDTLTWRPPFRTAPWLKDSIPYNETLWELTATKGDAKLVSYHPSMEMAELSAISLVKFLQDAR
jgi:hypothetical protein